MTEDGKTNEGGKEPTPVVLKEGQVIVDSATLAKVLEGQAALEAQLANETAKREGLEAMFAEQNPDDASGEKKLRQRKNFEPAFRTVAIKKLQKSDDPEDVGYVIGWTNRGAYQKVDKTGVAPMIVDYIDVIILGDERVTEGEKAGTLKAYSVPLLSLINSQEVNCKVLETKDYTGKPFRLSYPPTGQGEKIVATGEEIAVTTFDPKHGLVQTGDMIDGYVGFTDLTFVIQIPGVPEPLEIDAKYVNI